MALGELVYTSLQTHLRSGTLTAGQPLQEEYVAEMLGVSRTPVREAMMRLASEGLLGHRGAQLRRARAHPGRTSTTSTKCGS